MKQKQEKVKEAFQSKENLGDKEIRMIRAMRWVFDSMSMKRLFVLQIESTFEVTTS